jgi:molybdopterin synthase catalytic subunit
MFLIAADPLAAEAVEASVRSESFGGVVTFLGVVRSRADDGRAVVGLEYQAFEAMAVAEFERIAGEARERFGDLRLAIAHRTGRLHVGETAVVVAAAAEHRAAAFDACEYAIDQLKRRAPIWKRELYAAGGGEWKANRCDG